MASIRQNGLKAHSLPSLTLRTRVFLPRPKSRLASFFSNVLASLSVSLTAVGPHASPPAAPQTTRPKRRRAESEAADKQTKPEQKIGDTAIKDARLPNFCAANPPNTQVGIMASVAKLA